MYHNRKVLTAIVAVLLLLASSNAIMVNLAARETFEFIEDIHPGSALVFTYQVSKKEAGNVIDAVITDISSGERLLHQFVKTHQGTYTVLAETLKRRVRIELKNTYSVVSGVSVEFRLRNTQNDNSIKALDPLETEVSKIVEVAAELEKTQVELRTEQRDHRATVEDANERVLYWSIFQVAMLIAVSSFQLWFLKRFLERKSFV
ncbi:emp24/gp25L/p24 family/GOLD, putative [Angomonas deanei]|uniref:Emp24/gp25L/p24 family/GOLD, putative n=1 Tax=Angomonas deanei TaxID=59799 RepID=A0A7G2C3Q9_9TRYP|nr:emp24/gp25L/p24 family/GOLD, putative [Angomonas deanei]